MDATKSPLIQAQLDTEVYQQHQLYSNLFYDTTPEVMSALQVDGFGVHDKWMMISDEFDFVN